MQSKGHSHLNHKVYPKTTITTTKIDNNHHLNSNVSHSLEKSLSKSKSIELSKSKSKEKNIKIDILETLRNQQAQRVKIYFDANLKKQYMRNIVNKYFNPEDNYQNNHEKNNQNQQILSTSFINKRRSLISKFTEKQKQKLNHTIDHTSQSGNQAIQQKIRFSQELYKSIKFKRQNLTINVNEKEIKFPIVNRKSIDLKPKPTFFKTLNEHQYPSQQKQQFQNRKNDEQTQAKMLNNVLQNSLNCLRVSQEHKTLEQRKSVLYKHENQINRNKLLRKKISISPKKQNQKQKNSENLTKSILLYDQQSTNQELSVDIDHSIQFNEPSDLKSFSIGSSMSSIFMKSLPPIHQQYQSNFQDLTYRNHYDQLPIRQENLSATNINEVKTIQTKIFQNNSFIIFKIQKSKIYNNNSNLKCKQKFFKKLYKPNSIQLLNRQLKAKKIGVNLLWEQLQFQKHCLKVKGYPNLSKLLIKISKIQQTSQKSYLLINPRSYHKKLFQDNCKELLRIVKEICKSLLAVQGKLINNRINLNNIFLVNNYQISVGEWAYSSFRTQYNIQDKQFQKRLTPILKNQIQWFCTPQYLAPQLLKDMANDFEQDKSKIIQKNQQYDAFQQGNVSDVWSLGLAILEMITLIPVWINQKCVVAQRKNPKIVPRKGIFNVKERNLKKIIQKQLKIKQTLQKLISIQCENYQLNSIIPQLLDKMLQPQPKKRISLQQILTFLQI